jgi:hypothetical protein
MIGYDWMVDMMIIYIKKTFAKALDITTLSIFLGNVSSMSPNIFINDKIRPRIEI